MKWFSVTSEHKQSVEAQLEQSSVPFRLFDVDGSIVFYTEQDPQLILPDDALQTVTPKAPYVLASKEIQPAYSHITVRGATFGPESFQCIAGPCAVESLSQLETVADTLVSTGTHFLRAGAFKPRTSPYAFQGMGREGLQYLADVGRRFNVRIVSELMDTTDLSVVDDCVDVIQIGSRNMHNTTLLKAVGELDKPILLKRGFAATYDEFLLAAEYIMHAGNTQVMLCERGIRAFPDKTRNVLDLAGVAYLKHHTHLPVIVDPSHATGLSELVHPMALAALVVGADGIMVETHPDPRASVSDARQAIGLDEYQQLVAQLKPHSALLNKVVNQSESL